MNKEISRKALRFTRLEIGDWRNFVKAEINLGRRAFFYGANASGKSNLLDTFRFLRDLADEGLEKAVQKRGGVSNIRASDSKRPFPGAELSVAIGDSENKEIWRYKIRFKSDPYRWGVILVHSEIVSHKGEQIIKRPDREDKKDSALLTQTHLEQISKNTRFRELADFFKSIRYIHTVPQLIREPARWKGMSDDPYGGGFIKKLATTPTRTRKSRLKRISDILQITVPTIKELDVGQDADGIWHLKLRHKNWRSDGVIRDESSMSDGTLRFIGFLWSLSEGAGPLLLEEPEMSLHESILPTMPGAMARMHRKSGRQVILTTHSSRLLRDEGVGPGEVYFLSMKEARGASTEVIHAIADEGIMQMIEAGLPISSGIIDRTKPEKIEGMQLNLW